MVWASASTASGAIATFLIAGWGSFVPQIPPTPSPSPSPSPTNFSGVYVNPTNVSAGGTLRITAYCPNSKSGEVESEAFGTLSLAPAASGGGLFADATVRAGTPDGSYEVRVTCQDGTKVQTSLTVYAVPTSGPPTGGGYLANDHTPLLASGAVLIVAGGGLAAFVVRRRRQE